MTMKIKVPIGTASALAMLTGLGVGQLYRPGFLKALIPIALSMMLFPAMLNVEIGKIGKTMGSFRILGMTILLNFVLSPLLIIGLARLFLKNIHPDLVAGLVLYGIIPCGGMVPAFTSMKNGNVVLAVTTTTLCLLISISVVPIWARILLGAILPVPVLIIGKYLLLFIAVPLALAELSRKFLIRRNGVEGFQRTKQRIKNMEKFGLMLMLFILFVFNGKAVFESPLLIPKIMLPTVAFLLTLLFISKSISSIWRMRAEDAAAFIFCTTAKNNAISMALVFTAFGSQAAMANAITGPLVQLPMMLIYLNFTGLNKKQTARCEGASQD